MIGLTKILPVHGDNGRFLLLRQRDLDSHHTVVLFWCTGQNGLFLLLSRRDLDSHHTVVVFLVLACSVLN